MDEEEARRLPLDTDPDSIDDEAVRERFLARLHRSEEGHDDDDDDPRSGRRGGSAREFSHPAHWGGSSRPKNGSGGVIGKPTLRPPNRLSLSDGTGFAFGLLLYTLGISYIKHGPRGVTGWLSAKFLNRPYPDFLQHAAARRAQRGPKVGVEMPLDSPSLPPGTARRVSSQGPVKFV